MLPNASRFIGRNCVAAAVAALVFGIITMFAGGSPRAAAAKEYFTDEEIDYLRDAQGLAMRIPAIIRLANMRLVVLSLKEKSKEEKDLEKRIAEIHNEIIGKPGAKAKPGSRPEEPADVVGRPYLTEFTRLELLRGYIEAIDEIGSVIDSAYREKQDVRSSLEQFEKFLSATNPLLRRLQSRNAEEFEAILDARSATQDAMENAQDALKKVPKTEKSNRP